VEDSIREGGTSLNFLYRNSAEDVGNNATFENDYQLPNRRRDRDDLAFLNNPSVNSACVDFLQ